MNSQLFQQTGDRQYTSNFPTGELKLQPLLTPAAMSACAEDAQSRTGRKARVHALGVLRAGDGVAIAIAIAIAKEALPAGLMLARSRRTTLVREETRARMTLVARFAG